MRYSKSVVFLIAWLIWLTGKQLDSIVRYTTTSDYYIFSSIDMPWLYFAMAVPVFLLNICALYSLFRPHSHGIQVIYNAILLGGIQVLVSVSIAMRDVDGVRDAYIVRREFRGLPVREETANQVFSPEGMVMAAGIFLFLYLIVAYYTHRNRDYLFDKKAEI